MVFEIPLLNGTSAYIQLVRFFIALIIGVALTRLLLIPLTRKLVGRRADSKAVQSLGNLVGVLGLFVSFTVALQAGEFGNLQP
ncbi:MAG: hypothetical protein ABEJ87_00720 [Candidatus Nanohalobium sp.]